MLVVAPFAVLVGVLLTHRVAGPLVRIQAALEQMSKGDYQVQLTLRPGDSLSELADHVNQLAAILRRRSG